MEIQHSRHRHRLVLRSAMNVKYVCCDMCIEIIVRGSLYYCADCDFGLHYRCAVPLLQHIDHPLHPHHPLTLVTGRYYECPFCKLKCHTHSSYTCIECNFDMDVECALLPTITCQGIDERVHQRLCHLQPMTLVENYYSGVYHGVAFECCYVCQSPICAHQSGTTTTTPTFVCTVCKSFFHKSCTELSLKMKHPFHQTCSDISFRIAPYIGQSGLCGCCKRESYTFFFKCENYNGICRLFSFDFHMCVRCTFFRPTIKYEGDKAYLLCVFENFSFDRDHCDSPYGYYCQQSREEVRRELDCVKSIVLRCVISNFNLHLLCGPLPRTIKDKCHIHPLTLFESIIEDDSGEYYCDACETKRDPRSCVYYCAECKYIAHFHCVLSEVLRILKGDCREVELCVLGQSKFSAIEMDGSSRSNDIVRPVDIIDKETPTLVRTLDELIFSVCFSKLERPVRRMMYGGGVILKQVKEKERVKRLMKDKKEDRHEDEDKKEEEEEDEDEDEDDIIRDPELQIKKTIRYFSSFNKERNFYKFIHTLENSHNNTDQWSMKVTGQELELKIVNVGGYMITWNLARVLKDLLAKYGDISGKTSSSSSTTLGTIPEGKSLVYFFLCRLINSMSNIMIIDITEDLLIEWYNCLQFAKSQGFKIDSVIDSAGLETIVRAYFGLEAGRAKDDIRRKIATKREKIAELEAKLKRDKERLEAYAIQWGSETRDDDYSSGGETNFIKQCLDEASKLKWRKAAQCLFSL